MVKKNDTFIKVSKWRFSINKPHFTPKIELIAAKCSAKCSKTQGKMVLFAHVLGQQKPSMYKKITFPRIEKGHY